MYDLKNGSASNLSKAKVTEIQNATGTQLPVIVIRPQ